MIDGVNVGRYPITIQHMGYRSPLGNQHNYGQIHHFSQENSLFQWAGFNSHVKLPAGISHSHLIIIPFSSLLNHIKPHSTKVASLLSFPRGRCFDGLWEDTSVVWTRPMPTDIVLELDEIRSGGIDITRRLHKLHKFGYNPYITQMLHVWYVYLHLGHHWGKCV